MPFSLSTSFVKSLDLCTEIRAAILISRFHCGPAYSSFALGRKAISIIAFQGAGQIAVVLAPTVYDNRVYAGDIQRMSNVNRVHGDQLGTPVMLTNTDGNAVWEATFAPFGETVSLNEDPDGDGTAVTMNIRMPGQYFDAETGLNYNWHRYYDPAVGRYMETDPRVDRTSLANPYGYSENDPLVRSDRNGECASLDNCTDPDPDELQWIEVLQGILNNMPGYSACNPKCVPRYQICDLMGGYGALRGKETESGVDLCGDLILDRSTFDPYSGLGIEQQACLLLHELCHASGYEDCGAYTYQLECVRWFGLQERDLPKTAEDACDGVQEPPLGCDGMPFPDVGEPAPDPWL